MKNVKDILSKRRGFPKIWWLVGFLVFQAGMESKKVPPQLGLGGSSGGVMGVCSHLDISFRGCIRNLLRCVLHLLGVFLGVCVITLSTKPLQTQLIGIGLRSGWRDFGLIGTMKILRSEIKKHNNGWLLKYERAEYGENLYCCRKNQTIHLRENKLISSFKNDTSNIYY